MKAYLLILSLLAGISASTLAQTQFTQPGIDVLHYRFAIALSDISNQLNGETTIRFRFTEKTANSMWLDLVGLASDTAQADYEPTVWVSTCQAEEQIQIRVRDNGTGIPEAVKAKIFQPFFTTKPTGEGTGLGLSLSYDIVTKGHGGTMEVETKEGEGTTFLVKLPCA